MESEKSQPALRANPAPDLSARQGWPGLSSAACFVWGIWALSICGALAVVGLYAIRVPFGDDWHTVKILTGEEHITGGWLMRQVNEHRFPLVRFIVGQSVRLSNGVFVIENFLNVLCLGTAAAALLWAARRVRGRWSWADAFVPLLMLHPAHSEIWCIRMTLNHALAAALTCTLLALLVTQRDVLSPRRRVVTAAVMLLLPGCGANSLPVVMAGVCWFAFVGWQNWKKYPTGEHRSSSRFLLLLAGVCVIEMALYHIGYVRAAHLNAPGTVTQVLKVGAEALSQSLVPWTPDMSMWMLLFVPVVVLCSLMFLLRVWLTQRDQRTRCLALFLFLGATLSLSAAIGLGRASMGELAGTASRYATVTAPALLGCQFVFICFARSSGAQFFLPSILLFFLNAQIIHGLAICRGLHALDKEVQRDLQRGAPVEYMVSRYPGPLPGADAHDFATLRRKRIGPFRGWRPKTLGSGVPFAWQAPVELNDLTWDGHLGTATGNDPFLVFKLPAPQRVQAIRLRFVLDKPGLASPADLQVFWALSSVQQFNSTKRQYATKVAAGPHEQIVYVWTDADIDLLRIDPGSAPSNFVLKEITIFKPKNMQAAKTGSPSGTPASAESTEPIDQVQRN